MKLLGQLIQLVLIAITIQAIREQLSRPPEERTWHGRVRPVPLSWPFSPSVYRYAIR